MRCASRRTVGTLADRCSSRENVATKKHKRQARGLIEGLECRCACWTAGVAQPKSVSRGNFSANPIFFGQRLFQPAPQLQGPARDPGQRAALARPNVITREAAGHWMQLQSAYDHVIFPPAMRENLT